jgi:ADP-ribosylglycohydrolase
MTIPADYAERTYAGVLGKIVGVYLGRPFEGWWYDEIMEKLGEITGYVQYRQGKPKRFSDDSDRLNMPLIVTDDDISGTFTFLRALPDYGNTKNLTAEQIGQTWLNYLIEERTILWWGGLGNSTEHTAYLRLKHGLKAPHSGSIATNSQVVAEQIGAQIFIDGWGMVSPGDPEMAADLAKKAGSVSHDGEALYDAQIIAAMEAQAYVESDLNVLLDTAVKLIPNNSLTYRMINDIREWHAEFPDWHQTRDQIVENYGYDKYGGNCHTIPNHALIIMSLLHGNNDLTQSLMMVNTSGWDTDCNSGNVGCILGIKNGLSTFDNGYDWRGPVADRMYLPTADGGSAITDALTQTYKVVNIGRALAGEKAVQPKNGARFHFELPGSVQGFLVAEDNPSALEIKNAAGHSQAGTRSLALEYSNLQPNAPVRATTATFIPQEALVFTHYKLLASPTLYPGQKAHAHVSADEKNSSDVSVTLYLNYYGAGDKFVRCDGPMTMLKAGAAGDLEWTIPDLGGQPLAEIGFAISSAQKSGGSVYIDTLTWDGEPNVTFKKPNDGGTLWRRAWVDGVDQINNWWAEAYRLVQNEGTGLFIQGTRDWKNYRVSADVTPHMVKSAGLCVRVQGMRRYYALTLSNDGTVKLVKVLDDEHVLASKSYAWNLRQTYQLELEANGNHLRAWIDGQQFFDVEDTNQPLENGAIALICSEGRTATQVVKVTPA